MAHFFAKIPCTTKNKGGLGERGKAGWEGGGGMWARAWRGQTCRMLGFVWDPFLLGGGGGCIRKSP